MPTPFANLMSAGHALMQAQAPSVVVCGAVTKTGVSTVISKGKEDQAAGFLYAIEGSVELALDDIAALGLSETEQTRFTVDSLPVRVIRVMTIAANPIATVYFTKRQSA